MNFEIGGEILGRLTALARRLSQDLALVVSTALYKGLERLEEVKVQSSDFLSDEAKKDIEANPKLSHDELATRHNVVPLAVRKHRKFLARTYLKNGGWQTETDGAIGSRFGLMYDEIGALRRIEKLLRSRGRPFSLKAREYVQMLGGEEAIKQALTNGGKTLSDLFRDANINLTKERQRQVIGTIGLTGNPKQRTHLWYANRLLGPGKEEFARQLANRKILKKLIVDAGSATALAARIGVEPGNLFRIVKVVLTSAQYKSLIIKGTGELLELHCDEPSCGRTFSRPKAGVERLKKKKPNQKHFCCRACRNHFCGRLLGLLGRGKPRREHITEVVGSGSGA